MGSRPPLLLQAAGPATQMFQPLPNVGRCINRWETYEKMCTGREKKLALKQNVTSCENYSKPTEPSTAFSSLFCSSREQESQGSAHTLTHKINNVFLFINIVLTGDICHMSVFYHSFAHQIKDIMSRSLCEEATLLPAGSSNFLQG